MRSLNLSNFRSGTIAGIIGSTRTGKTRKSLETGFNLAEKFRYDLRVNFELNFESFYDYCQTNHLTWCMSRIESKDFDYKSFDNCKSYMDKQKTIYIIDEAQIYLHFRFCNDFESLSIFAQSRLLQIICLWIAPNVELLHPVVRGLTTQFI